MKLLNTYNNKKSGSEIALIPNPADDMRVGVSTVQILPRGGGFIKLLEQGELQVYLNQIFNWLAFLARIQLICHSEFFKYFVHKAPMGYGRL